MKRGKNDVPNAEALRAYDSVSQACSSIGRYLYESRRPHSTLDCSTPDQAYSPRCYSGWQSNPGRGSTHPRGNSIQATGTSSQEAAFARLAANAALRRLWGGIKAAPILSAKFLKPRLDGSMPTIAPPQDFTRKEPSRIVFQNQDDVRLADAAGA